MPETNTSTASWPSRQRQRTQGYLLSSCGSPSTPAIARYPCATRLSAFKESDSLLLGSESTEPHPRLIRGKGEAIVTKKRISALAGSDLALILRAHNVGHLLVAGIATSGVVLSTVREAADLDYRLTVLADICLGDDDEVHRVLTHKVFPRQADVIGSSDWRPAGA
jgi:nicotinamidase-related amidase